MHWSSRKLKVKTCTLNSNVGKATSIHQFLEERLPIKRYLNKPLIKWCKNISKRHKLIVHAQFRVVFNVQRSKDSKCTCIECIK